MSKISLSQIENNTILKGQYPDCSFHIENDINETGDWKQCIVSGSYSSAVNNDKLTAEEECKNILLDKPYCFLYSQKFHFLYIKDIIIIDSYFYNDELYVDYIALISTQLKNLPINNIDSKKMQRINNGIGFFIHKPDNFKNMILNRSGLYNITNLYHNAKIESYTKDNWKWIINIKKIIIDKSY